MSNASNPLFTAKLVLKRKFDGSIESDLPYGPHGQPMDIYRPRQASTALPAVIIVPGYRDSGFQQISGMSLRDLGVSRSLARLLTSMNLVAVTYSPEEPFKDGLDLLETLRREGESLGIDATRLGLWACSGNVPTALGLLQQADDLRCAVLCYGFMLDLAAGTAVAEAAAQFRFANPPAAEQFVRPQLPVLLVRAGLDQFAGVNASLDAFVTEALRRNCRLSLRNFAAGVHAFDILDDSAESCRVIEEELAFLQHHLSI